MHPIAKGALAAAVLASISSAASLRSQPRSVTVVRTAPSTPAPGELSALCPAGSLPDSTQCVPVPEGPLREGGPSLLAERNAHRDRHGLWNVYEQIPRRPDRPAPYARYVYPIPTSADADPVVSGYDLDRPDPEQRRGRGLSAVGHGGIDLQQQRGTEVRLVALEHQRGDAVVVFVGTLFGKTVVTQHSLLEGRRDRSYVVIYGHLDGTNPNLAPGAPCPAGTLLGVVGDSGSEGRVHLHLEVRQVREGADPSALRTNALVQTTVSIPCDPRNVLRLREE